MLQCYNDEDSACIKVSISSASGASHTTTIPATKNKSGTIHGWLMLKLQQVLVGLSLLLVATTSAATFFRAVKQQGSLATTILLLFCCRCATCINSC
jgi:hypothetical protein